MSQLKIAKAAGRCLKLICLLMQILFLQLPMWMLDQVLILRSANVYCNLLATATWPAISSSFSFMRIFFKCNFFVESISVLRVFIFPKYSFFSAPNRLSLFHVIVKLNVYCSVTHGKSSD